MEWWQIISILYAILVAVLTVCFLLAFLLGKFRHEEQLRERREYDLKRLRGDG